MALTVSNIVHHGLKDALMKLADCAFDSSYPAGGEALAPSAFGMTRFERVIAESKSGHLFEYDYTNSKLKAMELAPPYRFEETVTVTDNVGTLKYPHSAIMYVSSGNANYKVIPGTLTPVTGSVAVSEPVLGERGTLTFLAGDSVTSCTVTYATQAWRELFDNRVNLVIEAGVVTSGHASASFTAGTPDVISCGELALFVESVTWDDNGTYKPINALYKGETAATTEATIDFSNTSPVATTLSVLQTDTWDASTDTIYVNYIKKPSSGFLSDRFVEEDDLTPSSDVVTLSSGLAIESNALLFGTCGDLPGPTTKFAELIASTASVGTTATLVQPTTVQNSANTFTLGSGHADTDHVKVSYVCGKLGEIPLVPLEVADGSDLSGVTGVKLTVVGY